MYKTLWLVFIKVDKKLIQVRHNDFFYVFFHENEVHFLALLSFFSFQMHFAHISVIHILKAMGLRNSLVIRYWCHGLKYRRYEFCLQSGLKLDLNLTPSRIHPSKRSVCKIRSPSSQITFQWGLQWGNSRKLVFGHFMSWEHVRVV